MKEETKKKLKSVAARLAALALIVVGMVAFTHYTAGEESGEKHAVPGGLTVNAGEENGLTLTPYTAATTSGALPSYTVRVESTPAAALAFLTFSSMLNWTEAGVTDDLSAYLTAEAGNGNGVYILTCLQPFAHQATFTVKDQYNRSASVSLDYKAAVTGWEEVFYYTGDYNYGEAANLSAITTGFGIKYSATYGVGTIFPQIRFDEGTSAFFQPSFIEEFYAVAQDNYDLIDWSEEVAAPTLPERCFYNYGYAIGLNLPSGAEDDGLMSVSYFLPGYADMSSEMKRAAAVAFLSALGGTTYDDPNEDVSAPIAIDGWQDFSEFPGRTGEWDPADTDRVLYGINFDRNIFMEYQSMMENATVTTNVSSVIF